jgi:hypothetical protein
MRFAWEGVGRLQTWLRYEYDEDAGHQCLLALQLDALYFVDWALVVILPSTVKQSYLQGRASSVSNVAFSLDLHSKLMHFFVFCNMPISTVLGSCLRESEGEYLKIIKTHSCLFCQCADVK